MKRGKLIIFEGADGTGKTTQAAFTHKYLFTEGIRVVLTQEPGSKLFYITEKMREIIFPKDKRNRADSETQGLLFFVDHYFHAIKIDRYLKEGWWVISDRWGPLSQPAYNTVASGPRTISTELFETHEERQVSPDLVIQLEYPREVVEKRIVEREKKLKNQYQTLKSWGFEKDLYEKVSEAYREIRKKREDLDWRRIKPAVGLDSKEVFSTHIEPILEDFSAARKIGGS